MKIEEKRQYVKQCMGIIDHWSNKKMTRKEINDIMNVLNDLPDCIAIGLVKLMIHGKHLIMANNFSKLIKNVYFKEFMHQYREGGIPFSSSRCYGCLYKKPNMDCEQYVQRMIGRCEVEQEKELRLKTKEQMEEYLMSWIYD